MIDKQKVIDMFDECYRTYFIAENEDWSLCGECPFNNECQRVENYHTLCEIMTGRGTKKV